MNPAAGVDVIGRAGLSVIRGLKVVRWRVLEPLRLGNDYLYPGDYAEPRLLRIISGAAGLINAEEVEVADAYLGGSALAAPDASTFMSLFTTNPADDGTGATEASYAGYARVNLTNNATSWPNATGGAPTLKSNGVAITWGQKTDAGSINVNGVGVHSLVTAGSLRLFGTTAAPVAINQFDTPQCAIGDFDFKIGDPGDTF